MGVLFRMPHIVDAHRPPFFPRRPEPVDPYGLVAIGGVLSEPLLLEAYQKGVFPWYDRPPIMWYSPDPRAVLYPQDFHLSKRLARTIRQHRFLVSFDEDFSSVIDNCAAVPRPGQHGTWITPEMRAAYTDLHDSGYGHSVEVRRNGLLVGGLYGLSIGAAFFGESMFSLESDASKIAFHYLCLWAERKGFLFVDCQVPNPHLESLGAAVIPRRRFLSELAEALERPTLQYSWTDEARDLVGD